MKEVMMDAETIKLVIAGGLPLAGALIGAVAAFGGALLISRSQRLLARDTELRRWRLDQLQPTLDFANRFVTRFDEIIIASSDVLFGDVSQESQSALFQKLFSDAANYGHLGRYIVIGREDAQALDKSLVEFDGAYQACIHEIESRFRQANIAWRLGQPLPAVVPSKENLSRLRRAVITLNQATERYAFGRVGSRTPAETEEYALNLVKSVLWWEALVNRIPLLGRYITRNTPLTGQKPRAERHLTE